MTNEEIKGEALKKLREFLTTPGEDFEDVLLNAFSAIKILNQTIDKLKAQRTMNISDLIIQKHYDAFTRIENGEDEEKVMNDLLEALDV